jgi:hypothetical protein
MATERQHRFQIRGTVELIDGRWYSVVTIGGIDGTDMPTEEYTGPTGGLDTEADALTHYYEVVRPKLLEIATQAKAVGGSLVKVNEPTLH